MYAQTNAPYPNRIELVLAPFVGPFVQPGPLGAFDPRRDLQVYVDGVLQIVQTFSFDQVNNRYLLYMATAINVQGVIQIIYHVPSPPFVGGFGVPSSSTLLMVSSTLIGWGVSWGNSWGGSTYPNPVLLTATITSNVGTPTGTIQFYAGATPIGSPVTVVNGVASFTDSSLMLGANPLFAVYIPSGSPFPASTSNIVEEEVAVFATSTALVVSPNPTYVTNSVVLMATVTAAPAAPSDPTGTVQFYDGATPIGSPQTLVNGIASFTTEIGSPPVSLAVGVHNLTAVYTPNEPYFIGSISNIVSEDIIVFHTMTELVVT